jgi:hypothetical protein
MKHIKKYKIFEAKTLGTREKYLNHLIDENGNLHKRKGFIINVRRKSDLLNSGLIEIIVDSEWDYAKSDEVNKPHEYIAGIDINGYIIGHNFNDKGELLNSKGEVVTDKNGNVWFRNTNIKDYEKGGHLPEYSRLLDKLPSGWVNVKIDKEVVNKVERFSRRLVVNEVGTQALRTKLNKLKNPLYIGSKTDFANQVQQRISSLLILKYLEEIKEKFNATTGGFLFESFIAGLLNGKVPDDNSKVDVVGHDGTTTYQVKLVDWMSDSGNIRLFSTPKTTKKEVKEAVKQKEEKEKRVEGINHLDVWANRNNTNEQFFCDYYIIGLKQNNKIFIHIINKDDLGGYLIKSGISLAELRKKSAIKMSGPSASCYELNLGDLEQKAKKISDNLSSSLNNIWTNLSGIEYNIETITTGQNLEGNTIDWNEVSSIFDDCNKRLDIVAESLDSLKGSMNKTK